MFKKQTINVGDSYAVHTGTYAGELLIYIKKNVESLCFLTVPTMKNREIPMLVFENARNKGIIKFVEKVPSYIIKVSTEQYRINENSTDKLDSIKSSQIV